MGETWSSLSAGDFVKKTGWLAFLVVVLGVLITLMARCAGFVPTEVTFSAQGNTIRLARTTGREAEYLFMVQPQGWRSTDVWVDAEDDIEFVAAGSVNISMQRLIESIDRRHAVEALVRCAADPCPPVPRELDSARIREVLARERAVFRSLAPARRDSIAPEDAIRDPALVQYISPRYPWVGPQGDVNDLADRAYSARTVKKILPPERYGALIGLIKTGKEKPARRDFGNAFLIGDRAALEPGRKSPGSGCLWLGVNDVWDDTNPFPEKFYVDNIGSFWVNVKIKHQSGFLGSRHTSC